MQFNKAWAWLMAAVLVLYFVLAMRHAIDFIRSATLVGWAMGIALMTLPLIGAWLLFVEVRFGVRLERLVHRLEEQGGMPEPLTRMPSGRANLDEALAAFPAAADDARENPDSWESWLRLSMAYDAARDRKRARKAARKALELAAGG